MLKHRACVHRVTVCMCRGAGIAHNKILAKLASGMHKPASQTVVPLAGVPRLLRELPVAKLRQLGGKFGASVMDKLQISTVGEAYQLQCSRLTFPAHVN